MDPVVRRAHADDAEALSFLQATARDAMTDARGGALRLQECAPIDDWVALVDRDDVVVFAAALDDTVFGYLILELRADRDRGIITHAFVEQGARELGLGDALVEAAIEATRAANLGGIESTALPGDRETKNMFERAGLTARKLTVYKTLRETRA